MPGNVLDAERLKTDVLLKLDKLTAYQRYMYESALGQAMALRHGFEEIGDPTPEDLSLAFKEVMNFGFSQQALAIHFGVSTGTFSRWVSADNPPREYARKGIVEELEKIVDRIVERLERYTSKHSILKPPKRPAAITANNLRLVKRFGR